MPKPVDGLHHNNMARDRSNINLGSVADYESRINNVCKRILCVFWFHNLRLRENLTAFLLSNLDQTRTCVSTYTLQVHMSK